MDKKLWPILKRIRTILEEGALLAVEVERLKNSNSGALDRKQKELRNLRAEYGELFSEASAIDKRKTEEVVGNMQASRSRQTAVRKRREEINRKISSPRGSETGLFMGYSFDYGKETFFKDTLRKGKVWEERVMLFLKNLPETVSVKDVSDDPGYRKMDVDIIWGFRTSERRTETRLIDVKTNGSISGMLYLETIADVVRNKPGRFLSSAADYFYVVYPADNLLLMIPLLPAQKWYKENQARYQKRVNSHAAGDALSQVSEFACIPRDHMLHVPGVRFVRDFYEKNIVEETTDRLRGFFHR